MARGTTLTRLLDEVRAEARLSLNPAHNNQTRDQHIHVLQREQERLWEDYNWPHLRVERFIMTEIGQRYYDPRGAKNAAGEISGVIPVDRIERIFFKSDGEWMPVYSGIGQWHQAITDSALGQHSWPVARWQVAEEDQIEVWPITDIAADPEDQTGYLKIVGIRKLNPLVAPDDRADLDDRMLALYTAGNILAAAGSKDAELKIEAANKRYVRLKGEQAKLKAFRMFGIGMDESARRPAITHYRPPGV